MFILEKKITKQDLKDNRSEEEYMSFYLGIVPDKDLHINPLRSDKHPTASFYRAPNNELIFRDWKTGYHANFVDIVMTKYGLNYPEAIKQIARDFKIIDSKGPTNKPLVVYNGEKVDHSAGSIIQCELQDYTVNQLKWWKSFGINESTLKKFNVFSVKSLFVNCKYSCSSNPQNPIYGYYFGKEQNRELWKIYFPRKRTHRFLLNCSVLQGMKQLPKSGDILVITKSLKDVMCLYEMGIPAISTQAESVLISKKQYIALSKRFKYIIFNGDWDAAGQLFMAKSRRLYKGIALSFVNKNLYAKDISDYAKKESYEIAKELVDKTVTNVLNGKYDYQYKYCKTA